MAGKSDYLGAWTGHVLVDVQGRYIGAPPPGEDTPHGWYQDLVDRVWVFREEQLPEARKLALETGSLIIEVLTTVTVMDQPSERSSH